MPRCCCSMCAASLIALIFCVSVSTPASGQCNGPHPLIMPDASVNDLAGSAVALSGIRAILGAPQDDGPRGDEGSVSIFRFENSRWNHEARLVAPNAARFQQFGATVDISGDTTVVGYGGFGGLFPAFVFVRDSSNNSWSLQQEVFANPAIALEQFSSAVAIDGNTLVVGAPLHASTAGTSQGAAYVFTRSGTTWTQQAKLIPNDAAAFAEFGTSVDISGNTIVVGAPGDVRRAAYVFFRTGTAWAQQAKLTAGGKSPNMDFGRRVAIHVDTVAVGAPLNDGPAGADQGAVFVFDRSGASWTPRGTLRPSDASIDARFGASLAVYGDTLIVGRSISDDTLAAGMRGAAWIFERDGGVWSESVRVENLAATSWDRFGRSVAIDGDNALVGAPFAMVGPPMTQVRAGNAVSYRRVNGQWVRRIAGDADLDGQVTFIDVTIVIAYWGADYRPGTGPGDSNGDGIVNSLDLSAVTGNWRVLCQ